MSDAYGKGKANGCRRPSTAWMPDAAVCLCVPLACHPGTPRRSIARFDRRSRPVAGERHANPIFAVGKTATFAPHLSGRLSPVASLISYRRFCALSIAFSLSSFSETLTKTWTPSRRRCSLCDLRRITLSPGKCLKKDGKE